VGGRLASDFNLFESSKNIRNQPFTIVRRRSKEVQMSRIWNWAREEFWQILPVWAFFFVAFGLVALTRMTIFGEYHIKPQEQPEYLVGSLIMAKVVLLIDSFFKIRKPGRPLIYGALGNTGLYFVGAMVLYHVEQTISLMRHHHFEFAEATRVTLLAMEKPTFLTIMLAVLALTFTFCMLRELILAIGRERFIEMFFGRHARHRTEADDIRRAS
jgi:hypothetical protein